MSTADGETHTRQRRLVSLKANEPDRMLWHGESVLRGADRVGHVTSGAYGYTLGVPVGLAWLHAEAPITQAWLDSEPLEVEIRDRRVHAVASGDPFYSSATART